MAKTLIFYSSLVTFLTVLILQPFSFHIWDSVVNVIDPLFYSWNLDFNAHIFFKSGGNFLDTNIFYPLTNTIAYSDTLWGVSLLASPFIWITHNPIFTENLFIVLSFTLSALSMFALSYYLSKHTHGSLTTGLLYAFSYPRIAQIGHLPFLNNEWIPLLILYTLKFLDEGRIKPLLAAYFFFVLSYTTSIYLGLMIVPMLLIIVMTYICSWTIFKQYKILFQRMKIFLIAFVPFCIGILVVSIPYIRLAAEYPQYKRTLFDTMELRASPVDLISVTSHSLLQRLGFPEASAEHALYPTLTLLCLAIYGIYISKKLYRKLMYFGTLSTAIYILLSFGAEITIMGLTLDLPYKYLFDNFLLVQTIRVPARFVLFAYLNLIIFASVGLKHFLTGKKINTKFIFVLVVFFLEIWQVYTPFVTVPTGDNIPAVYSWLSSQPNTTVIAEIPLRLFYTGSSMSSQLLKRYTELNEMDNYASETYRMYFSTYHHKNMVNGYSGFFPDSYNKIAASMQNFPDENALLTLKENGVNTLIIHSKEFNRNFNEIESMLDKRKDIEFVRKFDDDFVYEIIR